MDAEGLEDLRTDY